MGGHEFMGGVGGSMMVFGMLFWIFVVAGTVMLILWLLQRKIGVVGDDRRETPLQILEKRYARGEITKARFEEMKRDITRYESEES